MEIQWVAASPWVALIAITVAAVARVVIVMWALRGTKPDDRPKILRAVACLFPVTSWTQARRKPEDEDVSP